MVRQRVDGVYLAVGRHPRSAVLLPNDEFVMSNRVDMPNVFDSVASGGYMKG